MSITQKRATELLAEFSKRHVIVVGDAFVDKYTHGLSERPNPEDSATPLLRYEEEPECFSGGAGNAARNCASLGARTELVTVIGGDSLGRKFPVLAAQEGYEARLVADPNRLTIEKHRFVEARKGRGFLRADFEGPRHTAPISEKFVNDVLNRVEAHITLIDGLLVSDYAKGVVTPALVMRLLDLAVKHKKAVFADVKPLMVEHFRGAATLTPNLVEGLEMIKGERDSSPIEIASVLSTLCNTRVFLTASEQGIYFAEKNGEVSWIKQTHRVLVGDGSGCGDTVAAMLLLATVSGATPLEAAELANAAGAVTVTKVGAYAPTPSEVLRMLGS